MYSCLFISSCIWKCTRELALWIARDMALYTHLVREREKRGKTSTGRRNGLNWGKTSELLGQL